MFYGRYCKDCPYVWTNTVGQLRYCTRFEPLPQVLRTSVLDRCNKAGIDLYMILAKMYARQISESDLTVRLSNTKYQVEV